MLQYSIQTSSKPKTKFARYLRSNQTPAEKIVWAKLRARRFHDLKFRRQVPFGPYIVDFLCKEKNLVIEIDGDSHFQEGAKEKDEIRQKYIEKKGFKVLRFGESQTREDIDSVLSSIGRELDLYKD